MVDLHALTTEIDPADLRANTLDAALNLLAIGLDPERCTLFVQSHVPEHTQADLAARVHRHHGRAAAHDPVQGQGKGAGIGPGGLFTYPVLMAADILLYDAAAVPVGDDQRQHLELTRDVALRFNHRYGETFVVPEAAIPGTGARVMDLQHPERKMSKSADSPLGTIRLLDSDEEITRKVRKAVTDTDGEMRYDREAKPGLANLLDLLAAATGRTPVEVAAGYERYGDLKNDVAAALCDLLRPVRERRAELETDLPYVHAVLARGAAHAHEVAAATYARAAEAIGLLPPGCPLKPDPEDAGSTSE